MHKFVYAFTILLSVMALPTGSNAATYYKNVPESQVISCQGKPARVMHKKKTTYLTYFSREANCQMSLTIKNKRVHMSFITDLNGMPIQPTNCSMIKNSCLTKVSS